MGRKVYTMVISDECKVYIFLNVKDFKEDPSSPYSLEEQMYNAAKGKKYCLYIDDIQSVNILQNTFRGYDFR